MKVFLGIIEVYLGLLDAALVVTSLSLVITRPNDWLLQCFVFILFIFLLSWGLFKIDKKRKNYISPVQRQTISEIQRSIDEATIQRDTLLHEIQNLESTRNTLNAEIESLYDETVVPLTHIADYEHLSSEEIKNKLLILRSKQDDMVRSGEALHVTNTGSKKIVSNQIKQILRCFNAECTNIIDHATIKNIDTSRSKIQRAFDVNNRIFAMDGVQLTHNYLASKLEELSTIYSYLIKVEEEKEQKRAIREQMVEDEKVRREIEREKKKINHDRQQFTQEVQRLMKYMQKTDNDVEKQLYIDKIHELEQKLRELESDEKTILERENNAKAGFVYIISNIGSFGEHVFKIGMTRRLEPMDRIAELSSASVPFPFDVHAMIFSENAPELEATLHHHFEAYKMNKVNPRKEFFRVHLEDIKQLVLERFGQTVNFIEVPNATEYQETLRIESQTTQ